MPKILSILLIFILTFSYLKPAAADTNQCSTTTVYEGQAIPALVQNIPPMSKETPDNKRWVVFKIIASKDPKNRDINTKYKVIFDYGALGTGETSRDNLSVDNEGALIDDKGNYPGIKYDPAAGTSLFQPGKHNIDVERKGVSGTYCKGTYEVLKDASGGIKDCKLDFQPPNPDENKEITVRGTVDPPGSYQLRVESKKSFNLEVNSEGKIQPINIGKFNPRQNPYAIALQTQQLDMASSVISGFPVFSFQDTNCIYQVQIAISGGSGVVTQPIQPGPPKPGSGGGRTGVDCSKEPSGCSTSAGEFCDPPANTQIKTAIGCIPTEPSALVGGLLRFAAGGAGGIALLLMIFGAFRMVTSAGNPESLKAGQEQFTAAVIGLLFIIFAVLLLQIIGVDILGLPGFTK